MTENSPHVVRTSFGTTHTQCTVDAIGIPAALGVAAHVKDQCGWCNRPITAAVSEAGGVEVTPASAVISVAGASSCCTDQGLPTMCTETNFFCSPAHATEWRQQHATLAASYLSPQEAAILGLSVWRDLTPDSPQMSDFIPG